MPTSSSQPLRVLHCPAIVGGHAQQLARAERELGLDSWSVSFQDSPYQFGCDEFLWEETTPRLVKEWRRWKLVWRAMTQFDVIHFNFGMTITPQRSSQGQWLRRLYSSWAELLDLRLLKQMGKRIVVTFQGDDARQGDFFHDNIEDVLISEVEHGYYNKAGDEHKRRRIREFSRYADHIYALNPDLLRVLPPDAQFMPYAHIDLREWNAPAAATGNSIPLVIHAPTHRGIKGTRFVLDAVQRLQSEGVPFSFQLVEGLSREEARKLYCKADLLIDQLLLGWYGGLAVELMALGKPVMCYIRQADLRFVPDQMKDDLPIIQASRDSLYLTLKDWLTTRKKRLAQIGKQSRAFVERWHDPSRVAGELMSAYRGEVLCSDFKRNREDSAAA